MDFHKIKMIGKYWLQSVPTLPSWTPDDESRLVYQESDENIYFGTSTGWSAVGSGGGTTVNIDRQEFTASAGQTVFNLSFNYTIGSNGLMVYSDNILMIKDVDYQETSTSSITFLSTRSAGEEITVINVSTNASIQRYDVAATSGQTLFTIPFSYVVGSNDLIVFSNNIMMIKGTDYTETSPTQITFASGRADSEDITFIHLGTSGEINDGTNLGSTGQLVYAGKSGTTLQFRKIHSLNGLATTIVSDTITTEPAFDSVSTFPGTLQSNDYFLIRRGSDGSYYKLPGSSVAGVGGTGMDFSYINISSTTDNGGLLTISQNGSSSNTYTYTLSNFSGIGLTSTQIRGIFITCDVSHDSINPGSYARVKAEFPDGSSIILDSSYGDTDNRSQSKSTYLLPINPSQTDFDITLETTDTNTTAEFTITGAWQRQSASVQFYAPIGSIMPFSGPTVQLPPNSLLCDGSEVSRTTYSELFAVIGTTYGVGDGSTTFNLPDLRGRTIIGQDDMGGTDSARIDSSVTPNRSSNSWAEDLGGTAGEDTHTLTDSEIGESSTGTTDSDTGLDIHEHTGYTTHNNIQPSMAMNYIIIASLDPSMPTASNTLKGWAHFGYSGGSLTIYDSYNVQSITRISAGRYQVNWIIPFTSSSYVTTASSGLDTCKITNKLTTSVEVRPREETSGVTPYLSDKDSTEINIIASGEQ